MKNIISITGDIASGKGVVSEIISKELKYDIYKASTAIRKLCEEEKITINEFQDYVATRPEFDRNIEKVMGEYANTHDNYIIEARTGWFTAPFSFKVYLTVQIEVAADRLCNTERGDIEKYDSKEDAIIAIRKRFEQERIRWISLYNKDILDKSNFDLVIDTTDKTPEEVAKIIISEYNNSREKEGLI